MHTQSSPRLARIVQFPSLPGRTSVPSPSASSALVEYPVCVHWNGRRGRRRYRHESDEDYAARQAHEAAQDARGDGLSVSAPPICEWTERHLCEVVDDILDRLPRDPGEGLEPAVNVDVGRWPQRRTYQRDSGSWLTVCNGLGFAGNLRLTEPLPPGAFARWFSGLLLSEVSLACHGRPEWGRAAGRGGVR